VLSRHFFVGVAFLYRDHFPYSAAICFFAGTGSTSVYQTLRARGGQILGECRFHATAR
jgi:hypothetical protein